MGSLDFVKPVLHLLPEVKPPERPPLLNERLLWTGIALAAFFIMYNTMAVGVSEGAGAFDFLQMVTASRMGSLITIGIGPIVLASIFLQLFAGAKIIDVDMSDPEEKATFQGTQKLLAMALCFFEAGIFVFLGRLGIAQTFFGNVLFTQLLIILQIAGGSLVLLYLDEVVSKHGLGSGIGLFIAAGVSFSIIGGAINLFIGPNGVVEALQTGGAEALPNAIIALSPLFFTLLVFFAVVYAEGIKVEIPLAFERARGLGQRFPIKFLYVSNIPVILASALLLNIQFFAASLPRTDIADPGLISYIGAVDANGRLMDGLLYLLRPIYAPRGVNHFAYLAHLISSPTPIFGIPGFFHIITYLLFLCILCVIFGKFWVETAGMGPKEVAEQLQKSGLQVPGYRRDPRVVERVLERYIPVITVLGSLFVGLLAGLADLTGALGTGTGVLLTVGILYRVYEQMSAQKMFDAYPMLRGIVGE